MKLEDLKGGSLSTTELHEIDGVRYIKKRINLVKEREYGFVRWYSQLKKIQRYSPLKEISTNCWCTDVVL